MPSPAEHVLALAVGVVVPLAGALRRRPEPRGTAEKLATYWSSAAALALLAAITLLVEGEGALDGLGLTRAPVRLGAGLALAATFLLLYAADALRQLAPGRIERTRERWRRDTPFLPATRREVLHSLSMVTSAAVCEEVVFRGFLVGYVRELAGAGLAGTTLAVGLPALVFAAAHAYQGLHAVPKVALLAGFFGILLVVTGSLWIPIALHFLVDLVAMLLAPRLLRPPHWSP